MSDYDRTRRGIINMILARPALVVLRNYYLPKSSCFVLYFTFYHVTTHILAQKKCLCDCEMRVL